MKIAIPCFNTSKSRQIITACVLILLVSSPALAVCTRYTSTDVPKTIYRPTVTWTESTITIPEAFTVADLSVTLNVAYSHVQDLEVFLRDPSGQLVLLVNNLQWGGANFSDTIFYDGATAQIDFALPPFASCYKPQGLLGFLNGLEAQGTWTLRIRSNSTTRTGTLNSWSLGFGCGCSTGSEGEDEGEVEVEGEGESEGEGEIEPPTPSVRIVGRPRVEVGELALLTAQTTGMQGLVSYAWTKDGIPLAATSAEYVIAEVDYDHAGLYIVTVEDQSKAVYTSEPFMLEVLPFGSLPVSSLFTMVIAAVALSGLGAAHQKYHNR